MLDDVLGLCDSVMKKTTFQTEVLPMINISQRLSLGTYKYIKKSEIKQQQIKTTQNE
jgi:hypothetical protein